MFTEYPKQCGIHVNLGESYTKTIFGSSILYYIKLNVWYINQYVIASFTDNDIGICVENLV